MTQYSARVRRKREHLGMSQIQLADAAGIDNSMICKIETGKAQPSLRTLEKIALALGTTASALLNDAEDELAATAESAD